MSTEQRKGQWAACTIQEFLQAHRDAAKEGGDGTLWRWVPAPDERDAEITRLKSELAEAKKPYPASRCRAIYYDGTTCDEHTREFDEQQAEILKCNRCATTRFADVASAIARVTERATRIYVEDAFNREALEDDPSVPLDDPDEAAKDKRRWRSAYADAMDGEPAHAEAVAKIKAGGA